MHVVAGASTGRRVAPYRYFPFSNFALQRPSLTTQKKTVSRTDTVFTLKLRFSCVDIAWRHLASAFCRPSDIN